jgi:hypothetical protein
MWGGNYNQYDSGIASDGTVLVNNSIDRYTSGTASYSGIKTAIDNGDYCIVRMHCSTHDSHFVVAYQATAASNTSILVMDPYNGELITLKTAMDIEGSDTVITENRIASHT